MLRRGMCERRDTACVDRQGLIQKIFEKKPDCRKGKGAMDIGTSSRASDAVKVGESRGMVRCDSSDKTVRGHVEPFGPWRLVGNLHRAAPGSSTTSLLPLALHSASSCVCAVSLLLMMPLCVSLIVWPRPPCQWPVLPG